MKKKLWILLVLLALRVHIGAQNYERSHISWELTGAEERIEKYRKGERVIHFMLPDGSPLTKEASVQIMLKNHEFNFGISLVQSWGIYNKPDFEKYRNYMEDVFNYVTLGFFWSWIEKTEGERIENEHTISNLEWAVTRQMTIKGMPLLWHQAIPQWINDMQDPEVVDQKIQEHIRYLINRYPDIMHWGVYNEAIAAYKSHVTENGIVKWVKYKGGPEPAVESLLSLCNEINPDKFYINNHYTYSDLEFKNLNHYLISKNADFDAIGIQTHMHSKQEILTEKQLWDLLEDYSQFNKPIHLTEITVLSSEPFNDWIELQQNDEEVRSAWLQKKTAPFRESNPELEQYQADYLMDFYTLAFSHPSVEAIIYWSGTDLNEWRGSAGGLLDRNYKPKPAYNVIKELIKEKWNTSIKDSTGEDGVLIFRGFFGDYQGVIRIENIDYNFNFTHSSNQNTELEVRIHAKSNKTYAP